MDKPHFPIRSQLVAGESFKGYVLREAAAMYYQSIKELHSVLGNRYAKGNFDITSERYADFVNVMAEYTLHDGQDFLDHFAHDVTFDIDENRHLKDIRFDAPKICAQCVKEGNLVIQQEWLYHHHTYCEKHGVELLTSCPCCGDGENFDWVTDVLFGCPKCGTRWDEVNIYASEVPAYQKVLKELASVNKKGFLSALYEAVVIVLKPFDSHESFYYKMPSSFLSPHELLSLAYDLLTRLDTRNSFQELMEDYWRKHVKNLSSDMLQILSQKVQRLPLFHDLELSSSPFSKQLMSSKAFRIDEGESGLFVSVEKMAQLLGVRGDDVSSLIRGHLFKSITQSKQTLVCLREIDRLIEKLRAKSMADNEMSNLISLSSLSKVADSYGCPYADVVEFALCEEILVYLKEGCSQLKLSDFCLSKKHAFEFLNDYLPQALSFPISMTQLKAVTKLSSVQAAKLIETLNLETIPISPKLVTYDAEPLSMFLRENLLLNRWAKLNKIDLRKLKSFLENYGIMPDESSLPKHQIWIYPKSEDLDRRLKYYLYLLHQYEGPSPFFLCAQSFQQFCRVITPFY